MASVFLTDNGIETKIFVKKLRLCRFRRPGICPDNCVTATPSPPLAQVAGDCRSLAARPPARRMGRASEAATTSAVAHRSSRSRAREMPV